MEVLAAEVYQKIAVTFDKPALSVFALSVVKLLFVYGHISYALPLALVVAFVSVGKSPTMLI